MTVDKPEQNGDGYVGHEIEIRRRVQQMRDEEVLDFIRETAVRLEALADRLEVFANVETRMDEIDVETEEGQGA